MAISDLIRFGTSTWTYEGWQGQVYKKTYPKSRFKLDCLAEYADFEYKGQRLFRTVGIDHTFYGPPTPKMLAHYAEQLPPGFQVCTKVWEDITVPVFPSGLRYAKKVGRNPHSWMPPISSTWRSRRLTSYLIQAFKVQAGGTLIGARGIRG